SVSGFSEEAERALLEHPWPGNVRELLNAVESAVAMKGEGQLIPEDLGVAAPSASRAQRAAAPDNAALNLRAAMNDVERQLIQQPPEPPAATRAEAAALLGLNRPTLVEKLRKLAA